MTFRLRYTAFSHHSLRLHDLGLLISLHSVAYSCRWPGPGRLPSYVSWVTPVSQGSVQIGFFESEILGFEVPKQRSVAFVTQNGKVYKERTAMSFGIIKSVTVSNKCYLDWGWGPVTR